MKTPPTALTNLARCALGVAATLAVPAVGRATSYTAANIRSAYGFNALPNTVNGAGQTIAILDFGNTPTVATDLAAFDTQFGFAPPPSFKVEDENGNVLNPATTTAVAAGSASFQQETALDVQFAHSIAPGANIVLIELPANAGGSDFSTGAATANGQASVVSLSIGFGVSPNNAATHQQFDAVLNKAGVAYTSAAGDHGDMNVPGTSPYVISIGGTSLTVNGRTNANSTSSTGGVRPAGGEVVWNTAGGGSSGGGIDPYETQPAGQQGAPGVVGTSRNIPDVAYDADPNTGEYFIYNGGTGVVGGTSIGAPQWAGLLALADQERIANGLGSLSTTDALNMMYGAYKTNPALYASLFNDVTSGSNSAGDTAVTGYDDVTGLGTPNAFALVNFLGGNTAVPEPASVLLVATGVALAARRRRAVAHV